MVGSSLRIIGSDLAVGMPYNSLLFLSNIESLKQRRVTTGKAFLNKKAVLSKR